MCDASPRFPTLWAQRRAMQPRAQTLSFDWSSTARSPQSAEDVALDPWLRAMRLCPLRPSAQAASCCFLGGGATTALREGLQEQHTASTCDQAPPAASPCYCPPCCLYVRPSLCSAQRHRAVLS
jgi:hypothetical protein